MIECGKYRFIDKIVDVYDVRSYDYIPNHVAVSITWEDEYGITWSTQLNDPIEIIQEDLRPLTTEELVEEIYCEKHYKNR